MIRPVSQVQKNSMLPFHATNRKKARNSRGLAAGANRKNARVRIFYKNYLCNSIDLFVSPAFLFLFFNRQPRNRLALINQSCFI